MLKTHKSSKKRIKISGCGKVFAKHSCHKRKLRKKSDNRKRELVKFYNLNNSTSKKFKTVLNA